MGRILLLVFLALFLILASLRRWKLFFGLVAAALAAALALLFVTVRPPEPERGGGLERVRLAYSPDKRALVTATAFGEALKSVHGLILDDIRLPAAPSSAALPECDALWIDGYRRLDRWTGTDRPPRKISAPFGTHLVVVAWAEPAAALARRGLVRIDGAGGEVVDPAGLLKLATADERWAALGLRDRPGAVRLLAPAPDGDGTGQRAVLWIAETLAGEGAMTPETLDGFLPAIREVYRRMDPLESSAMELFGRCVKEGAWAFPLVLVDEGSIVAFDRAFPAYRDTIREKIRVLRLPGAPMTVHPAAGFTPAGDRFLAALEFPETRALIWERHGLRPLGGASPTPPELAVHFGLGALPATAPEPPDPDVWDRLVRISSKP